MIRPNEIRTTMTAAAIVIIAATTVMISTAVAIRTAIGIKTAIGIGIKTAIASIRTETVIVTMTRITTAIIARTAAEDLTAETASGVVAYRRRIRADLTATTRAGSAIAEVTIKARAESMDRRMRDLYAHYGIPNNVPFNQIASSRAGPIVAY